MNGLILGVVLLLLGIYLSWRFGLKRNGQLVEDNLFGFLMVIAGAAAVIASFVVSIVNRSDIYDSYQQMNESVVKIQFVQGDKRQADLEDLISQLSRTKTKAVADCDSFFMIGFIQPDVCDEIRQIKPIAVGVKMAESNT
ncbi:TPA: hypothetical protein DF272_06495 [Candidatus Falkowbacteria bacterium]|nr:hypothetical protein [Candidatus Falkowbacteria bacterium]